MERNHSSSTNGKKGTYVTWVWVVAILVALVGFLAHEKVADDKAEITYIRIKVLELTERVLSLEQWRKSTYPAHP